MDIKIVSIDQIVSLKSGDIIIKHPHGIHKETHYRVSQNKPNIKIIYLWKLSFPDEEIILILPSQETEYKEILSGNFSIKKSN